MADSDKKKPGKIKSFGPMGLGFLFLALVLINVLFSDVRLRWDATENKIHSLSSGTQTILENLKNPITLKYYFSDDPTQMPPHFRAYGRRVDDLLREYETLGKGQIMLENIYPETDSEEEDWAKIYGIQGLPTATGENLYFGLVALSGEKEEVLPFLDPTKEISLEYDITRTIAQLSREKERHIGILSGMDIFGQSPTLGSGGGSGPWYFIKEMEKLATLHIINGQEKTLPENLDLLMLIQPGLLSPDMLFAMDTFITSGGNLLIFSDPAAISDPMAMYGTPPENPLNPLLTAWGLEISKDIVVDFNAITQLMGDNNQVENNPTWLSLDAASINQEDHITTGLSSLLLPISASLRIAEDTPLSSTILLSSSENSALMDPTLLHMGAGMEDLRRNFKATGKRYPLGLSLTGQFPVAFPDGTPKNSGFVEENLDKNQDETEKENEEKEEVKKALQEKKKILKPASLVLIADVDMLFDPYYMSRQNFLGLEMARIFNDNLSFVLNSVEMLSGSPELIDIRTRDILDRPFSRVRDLERQAETRWLVQEQALLRKAEEASARIEALEQQKEGEEALVLSEEQENELRKFNEEKIRINKELKQVRRNLRADIDALGTRIKLLNLLAVPLLVILAGLAIGLHRRKKSRESL